MRDGRLGEACIKLWNVFPRHTWNSGDFMTLSAQQLLCFDDSQKINVQAGSRRILNDYVQSIRGLHRSRRFAMPYRFQRCFDFLLRNLSNRHFSERGQNMQLQRSEPEPAFPSPFNSALRLSNAWRATSTRSDRSPTASRRLVFRLSMGSMARITIDLYSAARARASFKEKLVTPPCPISRRRPNMA